MYRTTKQYEKGSEIQNVNLQVKWIARKAVLEIIVFITNKRWKSHTTQGKLLLLLLEKAIQPFLNEGAGSE